MMLLLTMMTMRTFVMRMVAVRLVHPVDAFVQVTNIFVTQQSTVAVIDAANILTTKQNYLESEQKNILVRKVTQTIVT